MKTVHELKNDELNELRTRWFNEHLDDGSLEEIIGKDAREEDISIDIVKMYYEDTFFVEEDFWCNT
jgi:hypothetical protein